MKLAEVERPLSTIDAQDLSSRVHQRWSCLWTFVFPKCVSNLDNHNRSGSLL